jgi:membrane protease YdiL (CAAX protease family)
LLLSAATFLLSPQSSFFAVLRRLFLPRILFTQLWMLVVPLIIARTRNRHLVRLPRPRAVVVEALVALLMVPVAFANLVVMPTLVARLLGGMEPPPAPWAPLAGSFNRAEFVCFFLLAVTVAPFAEETFYRGFLYNALRQRFHPILAALMQAAVFGYNHPFGLANSIAIGMGALVITLVYEWRKTLLTPILLHAAVNGVGMTFLALTLAADAAPPRLGVYVEARQDGCLVTEVSPGSAADAAGLKINDVITSVSGEPVTDQPGLAGVVRKHQLGDKVSIEFLRGGTSHRADVVLVRLKQ